MRENFWTPTHKFQLLIKKKCSFQRKYCSQWGWCSKPRYLVFICAPAPFFFFFCSFFLLLLFFKQGISLFFSSIFLSFHFSFPLSFSLVQPLHFAWLNLWSSKPATFCVSDMWWVGEEGFLTSKASPRKDWLGQNNRNPGENSSFSQREAGNFSNEAISFSF